MAALELCTAAMSLNRINQHLGAIILIPIRRGFADSTGVSAAGRRGPPNRKPRRESGPPRYEKMSTDQDWTSVYPTAAAFKPCSVPLPVRMGYPVERGVHPAKEGNLELIKIPNFLHITPPAIKKHCEALKQFCTEWPSTLDSDVRCEEHFPIQMETKDFVFAGPSLRSPASRVVRLKVKLSCLNLDLHARRKLVKLAGPRYCRETDTLTLTADRCPLKRQNRDYAMYLLTALYHESWKTEAWEQEKTEEDMEEYVWEGSPSQKNVVDTLLRMRPDTEAEPCRDKLLTSAEVREYGTAVSQLKNEGESEEGVLRYREAVRQLLRL
ncbi:small ribosomal subunit protein mS35 [Paramormyrops kingsleyae]|uniref:Mitochondrial ribosomal protein S35 n=1 Tax=Paramormyrops kingsleyae TaxID=1676925 RepID=A0A3B3S1M1_9TELE|nr:28S ribosomal protein S35, mitochondrial [Paramormyrops kingsleyae]